VNDFNPNATVESVSVETAPKASIGIVVADAPAAPKAPAVSPEGYGYQSLPLSPDDPHNVETARQHRDGIDGFCSLLEWRLSNGAHWNSTHELEYQARRQKEIAFWRAFLTPNENFPAASMRRRLRELWSWPIKYGRRWSATTIATAITELELTEFLAA
jgi:hypothetical protein